MSPMVLVDPHDVLGWSIVIVGIIATVAAFALAIKYSVWPGERNVNHPKHLILNDRR